MKAYTNATAINLRSARASYCAGLVRKSNEGETEAQREAREKREDRDENDRYYGIGCGYDE